MAGGVLPEGSNRSPWVEEWPAKGQSVHKSDPCTASSVQAFCEATDPQSHN